MKKDTNSLKDMVIGALAMLVIVLLVMCVVSYMKPRNVSMAVVETQKILTPDDIPVSKTSNASTTGYYETSKEETTSPPTTEVPTEKSATSRFKPEEKILNLSKNVEIWTDRVGDYYAKYLNGQGGMPSTPMYEEELFGYIQTPNPTSLGEFCRDVMLAQIVAGVRSSWGEDYRCTSEDFKYYYTGDNIVQFDITFWDRDTYKSIKYEYLCTVNPKEKLGISEDPSKNK
jgi:hypothetical protein